MLNTIIYQNGKRLEVLMYEMSNSATRKKFRLREKIITYIYYFLVFGVVIALFSKVYEILFDISKKNGFIRFIIIL